MSWLASEDAEDEGTSKEVKCFRGWLTVLMTMLVEMQTGEAMLVRFPMKMRCLLGTGLPFLLGFVAGNLVLLHPCLALRARLNV